MRPFVDLLLEMTLLNDSWQKHRVVNILKGELKNKWRKAVSIQLCYIQMEIINYYKQFYIAK